MAGNKVYSGSWHSAVAAGNTQAIDFAVQSVGRELSIKSITFNLAIYNPAYTIKYDWRTMAGHITLTVGASNDRICHSFSTPSVVPAFMGSFIEIYEPGQTLFDGFFVANRLPMNLFIYNGDVDQRDYYTTVIVETQEKTMFR